MADYTIAMQGRPLSDYFKGFSDPMERKVRLAQLQAAQQESQIRQMQMNEMQRQQQEGAAMRQAGSQAVQAPAQAQVSDGGMNIGGLQLPPERSSVYGPASAKSPQDFRAAMLQGVSSNPAIAYHAPEMQAQYAAADAEQRKQAIAQQLQIGQLSTQQFTQHQQQIKDAVALAAPGYQMEQQGASPEQLQAEWTHALQSASQSGHDVSQFSPQYTPGAFQQIVAAGMSAKELYDADPRNGKTTTVQLGNGPAGPGGVYTLNPHGKLVGRLGDLPKTVAPAVHIQMGGQSGDLTPAALDQAARFYSSTGQMPSLGMGAAAAATRKQIMNRAAELNNGADLAANKATYRANSDSLTAVSKMKNAVEAYERTASKNLDLLISSAGKIRDTGSPLLNAPLRSIDEKALGSNEMAAFKAARQVALTEIARVVNNPNLSGVLSDSARHEIEGFSPESATLAQTLHIATVLRQDMKNRHDSLVEQEKYLRGEIGGKADTQDTSGAGGQPAASGGDFFSNFGGHAK